MNDNSAKKNPAAVALGRLAAGVPKNFSEADRARRRALMQEINKRRASKQKSGSPHAPAKSHPNKGEPLKTAGANHKKESKESYGAQHRKPERP